MNRCVSAILLLLIAICGLSADVAAQYVGMIGSARPSYLTTPLESLGVSSSNSAALNSAQIQSAFDNIGGQLTLNTCGTYQINTELQIGDNTSLILAPCVTMQRAAANMNMISTTAYHATPASVTLSAFNSSTVTFNCGACSPSTVTVTWTGMPLVNDQAIMFSNSGGALPTGITAATVYFVRNVSGNTFNVSLGTTASAAALTTTSTAGSGTNTATQTETSIKVTWTAHGKSVGDYISLEGANQSYYIGIFEVEQVVDANTLFVRTQRTPLAAPTGTTVARAANRKVKLLGGTWDYNYPTFGTSALLDAVGLFGYAQDVEIGNIRVKNGGTYGFDTGAIRDLWAHDITIDTTQDCFKVYGPAYQVNVERIDGKSTDDCVSFQTQENPGAFPTYIWTKGDLINMTARNIGSNSGVITGDVFALYLGGTGYADQINVDGIFGSTSAITSGSTAHLVLVSGYNAADPAGTITISRVRGWSVSNGVQFDYGTIQRARVTDIAFGGTPNPTLFATSSSYVYVSSVATIYDLTVDGASVPNGLFPAFTGGTWDFVLVDGGAVANLTLKNISIYQAGTVDVLRVSANSTTPVINLYDCSTSATPELVQLRSPQANAFSFGAGTQINFHGGFIQSAGALYSPLSGLSATFEGVNVITASTGIVTSDSSSAVIDIYDLGNKVGTNSWTGVYGNSPTFLLHTPIINFLSLTANQSGTNGTGAQTWFPGGGATGLTSPASTSYFMEGQIEIVVASGTTAHTLGLLFAGTASLTSIRYSTEALCQDASSFSAAAPQMMRGTVATVLTVWATSSSAANQVCTIWVRGVVRVNAAGTFIPQFQWITNAPGGTTTVQANTWFRMEPVGTNTVLKYGYWN